MSFAKIKQLPKTVQYFIAILSLGVIGLFFAFIFHDTHVMAFIGIGVAAAIAPALGVMLPLWAMETDVNDRPDIPKGPAHH
jgi:branched-subunit amino acid transport protein AzlD